MGEKKYNKIRPNKKNLNLVSTHKFLRGAKILFYLSIILICLLINIWILEEDKEDLRHIFFGLSTILVMLFVAGWILFGIGQSGSLGLNGFTRPGIFTLSLSLIVLIGIVGLFLKSKGEKEIVDKQEVEPPKRMAQAEKSEKKAGTVSNGTIRKGGINLKDELISGFDTLKNQQHDIIPLAKQYEEKMGEKISHPGPDKP